MGRKSDQRELFVILNQKNANLIEIDGELSHDKIKVVVRSNFVKSTVCTPGRFMN